MKPEFNRSPQPHQANSVSALVDDMKKLTLEEALFAAFENKDYVGTMAFIKDPKFDFSALNRQGKNTIHLIIEFRFDSGTINECIHRSAASGNAIHEINREGYTPLMLAVERGRLHIAKTLISLQATVNVDNNANCSAHVLNQKEKTIIHTQLLLEAEGDVGTAHTLALRRNIDSFETLLADQHAALASACERDNMAAARDIVNRNIDPSIVLMRTIDNSYASSVSTRRARTIKNLIKLGADVNVALRQALSKGRPGYATVCTLVALGASPHEAMEYTRQHNLHTNSWDLLKSFKDWEKSLLSAAISGNTAAVQFWADQRFLDLEWVFIKLINGGHKNAVKILIDQGLDVKPAFRRLLDDGNTKALEFLISAGADIAPILSEVEENRKKGITMNIKWIESLIQVGVDFSRMLLDAAQHPEKKPVARVLIAAGVSVDGALKHVTDAERAEVEKELDQAAKEVSLIAMALRGTRHAGGPLMGEILMNQDLRARPHTSRYYTQYADAVTKLRASEHHAEADLMHAIERADWRNIESLATRHRAAASNALIKTLAPNDLPSSRLLMHASIDLDPVIEMGVRQSEPTLAARLLLASPEPHRVLDALADSGQTTYAKNAILESKIDLYKIFNRLVESGNASALKKYIPTLVSGSGELLIACAQGNTALIKALHAAGADVNGALYSAIRGLHTDAIRPLMDLGPDLSVLLAKALTDEDATTAQTLLTLGADLNVALTHVDSRDMRKVQRQLS